MAHGHYHISEWFVYNEDGPRTNNHVEGWHNKINRLFSGVHRLAANHLKTDHNRIIRCYH